MGKECCGPKAEPIPEADDIIELRDGTEVADPRLGLLKQTDPRNDNYKVKRADKDDAVYEVDRVMNQGYDGSCVGYAFTHLLRAQGWDHPAIDEGFAWSVYTDAQRIDPWAGGEYDGARPHMAGTSLLAGVKTLHKSGFFPAYRWATTVNQVRAGLTTGPAVLGCMWRDSMDNANDDGVISVKGRRTGGHALLIAGVIGDLFVLTNSWGDEWGDGGTAFITEADLAKLLKDKVGTAVFPGYHESVA